MELNTMPENNSDYMVLLSWLDSIERFDVFILELRHLQETIANELRVPALYEPLEFEDKYL